MSDKVYLGPLLGYVKPNLAAVNARCMEIADEVVKAAEERAHRPHPLFARRPRGGSGVTVVESFRIPAGTPSDGRRVLGVFALDMDDHDPGDEDRR